MKTTITFLFIILSVVAVQAQESINLLTYENTQDINFFTNVKNGTPIKEYITTTKNSVKVGDTLILGSPTSQEMNTKTYSGSYGSRARGGISQSRSTSKKTYEFIQLGRPAGFGSVMSAMGGNA